MIANLDEDVLSAQDSARLILDGARLRLSAGRWSSFLADLKAGRYEG